MSKKEKKKKVPEESLFLRMLWLAQTFTCLYLIANVDPNIATIDLGGFKLPLLFFYFWTGLTGAMLSYHYRHEEVPWLEWLGLATIAGSCYWFVQNVKYQLDAGLDIDLLLPTVHLVAGLFVSHSFELKSRFDFNFSLVLSFILVFWTATLGKGTWFGIGMFTYIVLAATLLLLDCEARTFGSVQARKFEGSESYLTYDQGGGSEKTANLMMPTFALLGLSILFFLAVPRAESFADQVTSQLYSMIRKSREGASANTNFSKRVRSPFSPVDLEDKKRKEQQEELREQEQKQDEAREQQKREKEEKEKARKENEKREHEKKEQDKKAAALKTPSGKEEKGDKSKGVDASTAAKDPTDSAEGAEGKNGKKAQDGSGNASNGEKHSGGEKSDSAEKNKKDGDKTTNSGNGKSGAKSGSSKESAGGNSEGKGDGHSSSSSQSSKSNSSASTSAPGSKGDAKGNSPELSKEKGAGNNNSPDPNGPDKLDDKAKGNAPKETPKKNEIYTVSDEIDSNVPAETSDLTLFTVACNRTVYFRQGAYDNYDGRNWHVSRNIPVEQLPHGAGGTFGIKGDGALGLPVSVPAIKLEQKYKTVQNLGERLIFAGKPAEITYAGPSIITDSCGNLKGSWIMVKGFEYSVVSDDPIYDLASMRDEGLPDEEEEGRLRRSLSGFLQIPDSQSAKTYEMSKSIAGLQDNWFVQAEKICNHLRHNYKYSVDPKFKTKSKNNVDRFLYKTKTGDCKDFASAFVILCRASGIPTRMVVGYTPGDFDPSTGARDVKLKHAHAWAEIYYPSSGWVPFDATPHGVMPARINEEERYFKSMSQKVENTFKKISVVGGKAAEKGDGKAGTVQAAQNSHSGFPAITINLWDLVRWIPVAILSAALSGPVILFLKDIKGKIRLPKRMMPASKVYCKLMKDLKPIGVPSSESQTPGEFLRNLQIKLSESTDLEEAQSLSDAVEDFVDSYNATCFGGNGSVKELEQKRSKIGGLIKPFKK